MKTIWRNYCLLVVASILVLALPPSWAGTPTVSNIRATQRAQAQLVDVFYDLSAASGGPFSISVTISTNNGLNYSLLSPTVAGPGVGLAVTPGMRKKIIWNAGRDWPGQFSSTVKFRITATENVSATGLRGFYRFNGVANDESGSGNDCIMYGATFTSNRFGNANAAVHFNGVNNWLDCPSFIGLTNSNATTIAAWIHQPSFNQTYWETIAVFNRYRFQTFSGAGFLWEWIVPGGTQRVITFPGVLGAGEWHHVAAVRSGAVVSLFIDGQIVSNAEEVPLSYQAPGNYLRIGKDDVTGVGASDWYSGDMDDLRIYDRALSGSEIGQIYSEM